MKAPEEEVRLMGLISQGVWSDEVETLCRGFAFLTSILGKKTVRWQTFLPQRMRYSADLPDIPEGENLKVVTRSISQKLDGLAKMFQ